jgi:hypothetical protein
MPITGLDPQKCAQRNRLDALKYGVNAAAIHLAKQMPAYGEPGGPDHVRGHLPKSDQDALAMINAGLPPNATPLTLEQIYIVPLEAANSSYIEDRSMFLHTSTLKNIQVMAANRFAFMNSHRTGSLSTPSELPFGVVFAGRFERYPAQDGSPAPYERVMLQMYMLRGVYPNGQSGPSTDTLYKSIQAGTLFDVSMGLYGGYCLCDICGADFDSSDCPHYAGTTFGMSQEQQDAQKARGVPDGTATYTLYDGKPAEVSGVYDGAVPGAGFSKAVQAARHHKLPPGALAQARSSYSRLANKGDFAMYDDIIEQHADSFADKVVQKFRQVFSVVPPEEGEGERDIEDEEELIEGEDEEGSVEEGEAAEADGDQAPEVPKPSETLSHAAASSLSQPTDPRVQELEAKVEQLTAKEREQSARLFINGLVQDQRLLPGLRPEAVAYLNQAMLDDELAPATLTFKKADGRQVSLSRAELARTVLSLMPQHDLLRDHPIATLPEGAMVLKATATEPLDAYQQGLEQGKKFAQENYPDKKEEK